MIWGSFWGPFWGHFGSRKASSKQEGGKCEKCEFTYVFSYFLRVRGIQQLIDNRQQLIKQVVKIVVENKKPKKILKNEKMSSGGGRKREGCVKCAWSVLGGSPGRIDTTAPGTL